MQKLIEYHLNDNLLLWIMGNTSFNWLFLFLFVVVGGVWVLIPLWHKKLWWKISLLRYEPESVQYTTGTTKAWASKYLEKLVNKYLQINNWEVQMPLYQPSARALNCIYFLALRTRHFGLFFYSNFGYFVANLRTFLCTFYRPK